MGEQLLQEIQKLPFEQQKEVEDFVGYLASKYIGVKPKEDIAEKRLKNFGRFRGQIWMADDFNETPEDFKDYI
jgi:Protein of unknown function (DUF2281)